jgi:hypothetical protein
MRELPMVVIPHPLGGISPEQARAKARAAMDEIAAKMTARPGEDAPQRREPDLVIPAGSPQDVTAAFYRNGWTDGLPIVPPSPQAVREMLSGTDLPANHVLGAMPPRNGLATVEKIAINAVMAGCRPTYLPVLIAAVEAMLEKDFNLESVQTSTGAHSPVLLVNGPIRHQIRVNFSSGAMGHGWQANATLGRAIRFMLINIGGAHIGTSDMTTLGMAENISYCFAENEEQNPWMPFHVEQGFAAEDSTVSVMGAYSPEHVTDHVGVEPQEILAVVADAISRLTRFHLPAIEPMFSRDSLLVLCPEHAQSIARAGWTKKDIQQFVFEHSSLPYQKLKALRRRIDASKLRAGSEGETVPMFERPDGLKIIVAGGPGKHSAYINSGHTKKVITRKIAFPAGWSKLVERYQE